MIFIRHNKLKPPFDCYENLSLPELDALAMGVVNPEIQKIQSLHNISPAIIDALKQAEYILCSESIRTQQTAKQLMKLVGVSLDIQIDGRLNEIVFTPSKILLNSCKNPLREIRSALYQHIQLGGDFAEKKEGLETRISSLLNDYEHQHVICFSHGFFMRLITAYAHYSVDINTALKHIEKARSVGYLESCEFR